MPDMGREGPMSPSSGASIGVGGGPPAKGASGAKDPLQAQILLMQMVLKVRARLVGSVRLGSVHRATIVLSYLMFWLKYVVWRRRWERGLLFLPVFPMARLSRPSCQSRILLC